MVISKPDKIKIIFLSSSEFGLPALKKLTGDWRFFISSVMTLPDKPKGRGLKIETSPIKKEALNLGLKVLEVGDIKAQEWEREIKNQNPDVMVMASFGKIVPENILKIPPFGVLNIHPSLLPKFRGPSPIQSAILEGERETGVTIMLTDSEMDHGPILQDTRYKIQDTKIGYKELHEKLANLGADLIVKVIPDWIAGKIKPRPQDDSKATYTRKIKKEDGLIDWNEPAEIIERKVRAFESWPTAYFFFNKNDKMLRIQILAAEAFSALNLESGAIGKPFELDGCLAVKTGQGILKIIKLKLEGKREMSGEDFIKGYIKGIRHSTE